MNKAHHHGTAMNTNTHPQPRAQTARQRALATTSDRRWADVLARNPEADGRFWYSVATTGVYCRPSCAARRALPENVAFHTSREAAEQAGFRPCKRCRPREADAPAPHAASIARLCRLLESAATLPVLADMARLTSLSPSHLQRLFKQYTGLTPKQYALGQRAQRLRSGLGAGMPVTDALYAAGFNSSGRFYDNAARVLGMTPSRYRQGGKDSTIRYATGTCTLGAILVAQSERGLCAILMGDDAAALAAELRQRFPQALLAGDDVQHQQQLAQVIAFVDDPALGLDLPLDVRGTAFQQRVWRALTAIPLGKTASYADIARSIGAPQAVRAVGSACAANTLAVAIPCHRVVRSDGALSGYRWGLERKRALLKKESRQAPDESAGSDGEAGR